MAEKKKKSVKMKVWSFGYIQYYDRNFKPTRFKKIPFTEKTVTVPAR